MNQSCRFKLWIQTSWEWGRQQSHTSLRGVALDPRGDGRRSHFVAAGHAEVVPGHGLQPGDFVLERRRRDVDHPSHPHLSFPPTHLSDLGSIRKPVMTNGLGGGRARVGRRLTLMWHFVIGEKPSCPGIQLNISLLDRLSVTVRPVTGLGGAAKPHENSC